jgi:hypothetical protein
LWSIARVWTSRGLRKSNSGGIGRSSWVQADPERHRPLAEIGHRDRRPQETVLEREALRGPVAERQPRRGPAEHHRRLAVGLRGHRPRTQPAVAVDGVRLIRQAALELDRPTLPGEPAVADPPGERHERETRHVERRGPARRERPHEVEAAIAERRDRAALGRGEHELERSVAQGQAWRVGHS